MARHHGWCGSAAANSKGGERFRLCRPITELWLLSLWLKSLHTNKHSHSHTNSASIQITKWHCQYIACLPACSSCTACSAVAQFHTDVSFICMSSMVPLNHAWTKLHTTHTNIHFCGPFVAFLLLSFFSFTFLCFVSHYSGCAPRDVCIHEGVRCIGGCTRYRHEISHSRPVSIFIFFKSKYSTSAHARFVSEIVIKKLTLVQKGAKEKILLVKYGQVVPWPLINYPNANTSFSQVHLIVILRFPSKLTLSLSCFASFSIPSSIASVSRCINNNNNGIVAYFTVKVSTGRQIKVGICCQPSPVWVVHTQWEVHTVHTARQKYYSHVNDTLMKSALRMYTYAVWSVAVDKQKQTEKWKKKSELSFSDIFFIL